jgi:hypothetical protein
MLSLKPQLSLNKNQLFIAHDGERKKSLPLDMNMFSLITLRKISGKK